MEINLVNEPAEVNTVVLKKKKRRRKRCKGKAGNALVLQDANQADKMEDDLEFGKISQLQDTVMDVDIATRLFEENLKTNLDSGTNSGANLKARKKRRKRANKKAGRNSESQCKDNGGIVSSPNLAESADGQIVSMTPAAQRVEAANPLCLVPFQVPERVRKKLLILDLNGLLADIVLPPPPDCKSDTNISRRAIFKRPFYYDFLKFCFERFNVGVWSSRSKKIVDRVVDYLFGHLKHKLLFCWHMLHCTQTCFRTLENRYKPLVFKELRKLWEKHDAKLPWKKGDYNESNTLLLDDSPYKALLNPINTAVFPFTYSYKDVGDTSLGVAGDLRVYLEALAKAENVQTYIGQNPFGQNAINEQSPFWSFYSKVVSSASAESK